MAPSSAKKVLREASAMFTQARYAARDLRVTHEPGSGPCVVLLHGLYATAGVFRPLRRRLHRQFDASTHSLSYLPGVSVDALEDRLASLISAVPGDAPLVLIGHSFGGLAVRSYAARPEANPRLVQTVSLATPFLGSLKNNWVPSPGCHDLEPGAARLERLMSGSAENARVPHLTICAAEDQLVVPGAFPNYGEHLLVPDTGHNGILFDERAHDAICSTLSSLT